MTDCPTCGRAGYNRHAQRLRTMLQGMGYVVTLESASMIRWRHKVSQYPIGLRHAHDWTLLVDEALVDSLIADARVGQRGAA